MERSSPPYAPRVLDVVVTAVVVSGFVLLGVAAARHGRWHDDFVAQLRAQRLWPREVEATVAWVVTGAEAVVGALGVLLLAFGVGAVALTPLLGGLVVLGVGFVGLQVFLLVARPEAPCGCDPAHDTRVGVGTLGKAAWPAVAGVVGLVALPAEALDSLSLVAALVAVFVGLALAWAVDAAPAWIDRGTGGQPAS